MIFDWDLWPWRVAEGAGPLALNMLRAERSIHRVSRAIGEVLLPAFRSLQIGMVEASRRLAAVADGIGYRA